MSKLYIETTIPSFYYNQRPEPEMVARCNWTRQWWDAQISEFEAATSYQDDEKAMYLKIDPQIHWDIRIFFGQKRVFQQPATW